MRRFLLRAALVGLVVVLAGGMLFLRMFSKGVYLLAYPAAAGWTENKAIEFYGRVVDQDGKGVAGAKMRGRCEGFSLTEYVGGRAYSPHPIEVVTDSDGFFNLKGLSAKSLYWDECTASGYISKPQLKVCNYSGDSVTVFKPDAAHPVVFNLWKMGKTPAKIINFYDRFNLTSGETKSVSFGVSDRVEEGKNDKADMQVTVTWDLPADVNAPNGPKSKFNWTLAIDIPGGGIIPSKDAYLYKAPADGYAGHYEEHHDKSDPEWSPLVTNFDWFYVHSGEKKKYSAFRLIMSIRPYSHTASIDLLGNRNVDGSGNLEPEQPPVGNKWGYRGP